MPKSFRFAAILMSSSLAAGSVAAGEKSADQVSHFYGSFSYSIPIEVPAFHGIEPRLALSYSSEGRNGHVGVGWSLSGISTIDLRHRFWLDGQELLWCGAWPSPGPSVTCLPSGGGNPNYYFTRDESYLRVEQPSPTQFFVYGKDGTKTKFSPTISSSGYYPFRFGQTEVKDTKNNTVTYTWSPFGGDDSYPAAISYNGYTVTFYREDRPDVQSFSAFDHVATTLKRIRSIAVRQGTNLIRAYKLTYSTSPSTGRSLLASVQQFGKDASVDANGVVSGGTSLPAQTFSYQNDTIAKSFVPTTGGPGTSWCTVPLKTGDFNGDGRTDLICFQNGNFRVALSTGSNFASPTVWSTNYAGHMGDFNGDGKTDLLLFDSWPGDVYVHLSTGSSFAAPTYWGTVSADNSTCRMFVDNFIPHDLNSDGKTDIFCQQLSEGGGEWVGFSTGTAFSVGKWGQWGCPSPSFLDVDGDRLDDLFCHAWSYVYRNAGSTFQYPYSIAATCGAADSIFGDVNGDGRTDITCNSNGQVFRGTPSAPYFVATSPAGAVCAGTTDVFAADVDGDGASELVCNKPGVTATDIQVRKWSGGLMAAETWLGSFCNNSLRPGDFNGDGKTDIACEASSTSFAAAGTSGFQSDLIATAANGLGGTIETEYTSSTSFANSINNPPPKWAITQVTRSDGRGGMSTTDYTYSGAFMNRTEGRFMGFQWATELLPLNAGETQRPFNLFKFKQDLHSAGKLEASFRANGAGVHLQQSEFTYWNNGATLPRRSLLTEQRSYTWDGSGVFCSTWPCATGKRTHTSYTYNTFGNVIQQVSKGDEDATGDETTTTFAYFPNTTAYIVDRLARTRVWSGVVAGVGLPLSVRRVFYDEASSWTTPPTQGYPTTFDDWLSPHADPDKRVATTTVYDAFGNPTTVTDPTIRSVTTTWDSTFHVFPVSITNGANETISTAWDPTCGMPTATTNPNNQVTNYAPADALCRPTTTTDPLGGFETRSYLGLGDPNNQRVRIETPSGDGVGNHFVETFFDGFGRTWKTVSRGPSPTQDIVTLTTFHPRGGVATQTEPHYSGETPRTRGYTYDAQDRLTETRLLPTTVLSTTSYGLRTQTATDENGKSTTTRFDAFGRQTQVERSLSGGSVVTNYTHDVLGRLTGMADHLGHARSWEFDSLGRNTQKNDPDAGVWSFAYDDAGRLVSQTDAKSQVTTFEYDPPAGRLTTKTNSAGTVTTTFSEPRPGYFNVGLPTTITSPSSVLRLDYDKVGRAVKRTRTLDAVDYVLTRTYDAGGFMRGITYPDGDQVGTTQDPLGYDSSGRLNLVPGILTSVTYDAAGRPLVQTNANGTATTRTYSAARGFLERILTTPGTPPIQDLQYTLDTPGWVGLVSQVTSPHANEGWSYDYDDLLRLTAATNTSTPAESQSWMYDEIGRISANSRLGNYTYPGVSQARPHAPLTAGALSFTNYDANGNLVVGAGRTIAWDANNRITQVTSAAGVASFVYDASGERLSKTVGSSTTRYPMRDYEIAPNGHVTKYIVVASLGLIAKRSSSSGQTTTYWLHTDRSRSVNVTTDSVGSVIERRNYRPYGEEMAPVNSAPGWIGERTDVETNLAYLGARYHDPSLGLFLSPDPANADPNTYRYAHGNPTNFADPGGLDDGPIDPCFTIGCLSYEDIYGDQRTPERDIGLSQYEQSLPTIVVAYTYPEPTGQSPSPPPTGQSSTSQPSQGQGPPPSSTTVLGRTVTITYDASLSGAQRGTAGARIEDSAGLLNSNASRFSSDERRAIGQIGSISVVGRNRMQGYAGGGNWILGIGYIDASSPAWLASLFGHEGQHALNRGLYSGDNQWRNEQSAGRTQLGIGISVGFTQGEITYLQTWTADSNRQILQGHMRNGYRH